MSEGIPILEDKEYVYDPANDTGDYIQKGGTIGIIRYYLNCGSSSHYTQSILYSNPSITPYFIKRNPNVSDYWQCFEAMFQNPQFEFSKVENFISYFTNKYNVDEYNANMTKIISKPSSHIWQISRDIPLNEYLLEQMLNITYSPNTYFRCVITSLEIINNYTAYYKYLCSVCPTINRTVFTTSQFENKLISTYIYNANIGGSNVDYPFLVKYLPDYNHIITYNIIKQNPKYKWDYKYLSWNKGIKIHDVLENPDKPWDYDNLSMNPNITWPIVCKYKHIPWNYKNIIRNHNITYEIIENAIRDKPILSEQFGNCWTSLYQENSNYTYDLFLKHKDNDGLKLEVFRNVYTFNNTVYKNNVIKYITNSKFIIQNVYLFIIEYINPERYNF